jgi:hypothetical protein
MSKKIKDEINKPWQPVVKKYEVNEECMITTTADDTDEH